MSSRSALRWTCGVSLTSVALETASRSMDARGPLTDEPSTRSIARSLTMTPSKQPIPEGLHTITPQLVVKDANSALDFYKRALGAIELARMPGPNGLIMHSSMRIGDSVFFLNDEMPMPGSVKSPPALGG